MFSNLFFVVVWLVQTCFPDPGSHVLAADGEG